VNFFYCKKLRKGCESKKKIIIILVQGYPKREREGLAKKNKKRDFEWEMGRRENLWQKAENFIS
jgi:hypothetical protein